MNNRLSTENSPYLLQHAQNPVDWYPWGAEAFQAASDENKPILLSVGYSSCHWCHVMEKESFSDPIIATKMNRLFINIKVDREERPDVDNLYMQALQAMTGQGGWPMTMFLTPDGKPFFGGTYYPPEDFHGMPSFERILDAVSDAHTDQINEIHVASAEIIRRIQEMAHPSSQGQDISTDALGASFTAFDAAFDPSHGGFGGAPKFPQPLVLEFLLRHYKGTGNAKALEMVTTTLDAIAEGGIRDHLAGGFHRYATDSFWAIPHFEKMLYDNALLTSVYLHAFQITGNSNYKSIVEETIDYVLREMTADSGGFYASQDADTNGEEGVTYVWSKKQIAVLFDQDTAEMVCGYYGITDTGNFEGSTVLSVRHNLPQQIFGQIKEVRSKLLTARNERPQPFTDTKIIVAWNGLMLRGLAEAGTTLGRPDYMAAATKNAQFLLDNLIVDGRLVRSSYNGSPSPINAYLEDYASLGLGLLTLYESSLEPKWLQAAIELSDRLLDLFWEDSTQLLYDTGFDQEPLLIRPRDIIDNAIPCGNSLAAEFLLRMGTLNDNVMLRNTVETMLKTVSPLIMRSPSGFGNWLCAIDYYLSSSAEIILIGKSKEEVTEFLKVLKTQYHPNIVIAAKISDSQEPKLSLAIFEAAMPQHEGAIAMICRRFVCAAPASNPAELAQRMLEESI